MIVVSDTSPVNYLVLIGYIDLLPRLFEKVILPRRVYDELASTDSPDIVRNWIDLPHDWLDILDVSIVINETAIEALDSGEREAITLAVELRADMILIDDKRGREAELGYAYPIADNLIESGD